MNYINNLPCRDCGGSLELEVKWKKYCKDCARIRIEKRAKVNYYKRHYKRRLRKFYDFAKIPLIQSPYFVDKEELILDEIIQETIILEIKSDVRRSK